MNKHLLPNGDERLMELATFAALLLEELEKYAHPKASEEVKSTAYSQVKIAVIALNQCTYEILNAPPLL